MLKDESGSLTTAAAIFIPGLMLGAAMVVDFLLLNAHRSHLQAQADMAALEAVRFVSDEKRAYAQAVTSVALNDRFEARVLRRQDMDLGRVEAGLFVPQSLHAGNPNAARVVATADSRMPISAILGREGGAVIQRHAVARADRRVSFSLSNCLLSLNLFHGALRPFLGAELDAICSDGALAVEADVLMETLALDLDAPLTYGDVLDADIGLSALWSAALGVAVDAPDATIRLGDLLHLDSNSRGALIGSRIPGGMLSPGDLVFGSLELLGEHAVDLDLRADLGPLAQVPVALTVIEPRRIVMDVEPGSPEAYAETAQVRLAVQGLDLLGLVKVDLGLEVARASARLGNRGTLCAPPGETAAVIFDPVEAGLLELKIGLSALGLQVSDTIDLVETGPQAVGFSFEDIRKQRAKEISPRLEGTLNDVAGEVTDLLDVLPLLGGVVGGLLQPVTNTLAPVEAALGAVVHDFVGLAIAPAVLTVHSADCAVKLVQ